MAEYAHLSTIDPEFAPIAEAIPPVNPPIDFNVVRATLEKMLPARLERFKFLLPEESEYSWTDVDVPVEEGVEVKARVVIPSKRDGEDGKFPLFFWLHGGGFSIGTRELDDYRFRRIAVDQRVVVVNCEYRLAPEHPFPTGVNDAFAALKYVRANPDKFSTDLSRGFIVGGISAGANFTAVISHLARDDPDFKDTPLTGLFLQIPSLCFVEAYPEEYKPVLLSQEQNKNAPLLTRDMRAAFMGAYKATATDPRASPLLFPSHENLPPTYFQICGLDPLRDEAFLYEKLLKEKGVRTKVDVYPGVPHGFEAYAPHITQGRKLFADSGLATAWLLSGGKD